MLAVIDAGYFYAGLIIEDGEVIEAAPIIKYMEGWTVKAVTHYCNRKGWRIKRAEP